MGENHPQEKNKNIIIINIIFTGRRNPGA